MINFSSADAGDLVLVGLITTGYGIYLIKCGIQGDTLMPGTLFMHLPRWVFILTGLLFQLPLAAACWFLHEVKYL